jgi:hypothetical protein
VHQEQPRIGQIERAAQRGGIQVVQVARDHLHVAQLKGGNDRSCPLNRRLADIDANDASGGADHLPHDRKAADRATAAVDRVPPLLDTKPAERCAGRLRILLGDAQQPPQILIRAVMDVTPDPLCNLFGHARLPALAYCTDPIQPARLSPSTRLRACGKT